MSLIKKKYHTLYEFLSISRPCTHDLHLFSVRLKVLCCRTGLFPFTDSTSDRNYKGVFNFMYTMQELPPQSCRVTILQLN